MPLIYSNQPYPDTKAGVWRIEEPPEFFLKHLIFSNWERQFYNGLKHPERQMSWLSSRYLLKLLLDTREYVELLFDTNGKPFLGSGSHRISLSHTHKYAAAIISESEEVGVDVEDAGRDIGHLSRKFLSDAERRFLGEQPPNEELLLYWGAKEVIYKMYGRRKLDFRQDMFIRPFQVADKGVMA
ncbi:MAG TPA: 4'-phosphopantetheinyl transferase superfamily protein, partial [Chitinophagales bacterium]|nr:4'-phosphopantetheinyl transferase superfamily protein [Chitinophagales bacterium]